MTFEEIKREVNITEEDREYLPVDKEFYFTWEDTLWAHTHTVCTCHVTSEDGVEFDKYYTVGVLPYQTFDDIEDAKEAFANYCEKANESYVSWDMTQQYMMGHESGLW